MEQYNHWEIWNKYVNWIPKIENNQVYKLPWNFSFKLIQDAVHYQEYNRVGGYNNIGLVMLGLSINWL